jgi:diguanylate cyclase (GGDEF)-like protein
VTGRANFVYGPLDIRFGGAVLPRRAIATRGHERRQRAYERARVRRHARWAVLVVPALALFNFMILSVVGGRVAWEVLAIQGSIGLLGGIAHFLLRGPARGHPALIVGVLAAAATAASALVGLTMPSMVAFGAGYLLLTPVTVALLIPWRPAIHLRWLVVHLAIALPALWIMPALAGGDRVALVITALAAAGVSAGGNLLAQHEDARYFRLRRDLIARREALRAANSALEASLRHDPLTGARNRLRLTEDLAEARSVISRTGATWGLLTVDIDRFKQVNDRFGHGHGDLTLRKVVAALSGVLRPGDGVYRTGGEEFVVLLARLSADGVVTLAERLRAAVEAVGLPNPDNTGGKDSPTGGVVTVSVGVVVVGDRDLDSNDDAWLARADRALYAAKAGGRNRIELA